jgi:hypothetical protein
MSDLVDLCPWEWSEHSEYGEIRVNLIDELSEIGN